MKRSLILLLLTASLLLTACQAAPTPTLVPTITIKTTATTLAGEPSATPAGNPASPLATTAPTPGSAEGYPASPQVPQPNSPALPSMNDAYPAYPPVPADDALARGNFLIQSANLAPDPDLPGQADLVLEGSLPTPCNQLRVKVNPANAQKQILVEVYSVVQKDMVCADVIKPFAGVVARLSGYPSGKYTVIVNDVKAGELTVP